MTVRRDDQLLDLNLRLTEGWRRAGDRSWRVSSGGLGRMVTGGMRLRALDADERKDLGIDNGMALRATHVGQYGAHGAAKRAGLRKGDIVVAYDGRNDLQRESELVAYAVDQHEPGDQVEVEAIRDGSRMTFTLPIQE